MTTTTLPPDGTMVTAKTYPSIEYDRPAKKVSGKLHTRWVHALEYTQCWVNGVQVDPDSVEGKETTDNEVTTNDEGRWITIGGRQEGGSKHKGGTKVFIKDGRIQWGNVPAKLRGTAIKDFRENIKEHTKAHEARGLKPAHEMTSKEWSNHLLEHDQRKHIGDAQRVKIAHEEAVRQALREGKEVPKEVQKEYFAGKKVEKYEGTGTYGKEHLDHKYGVEAKKLGHPEKETEHGEPTEQPSTTESGRGESVPTRIEGVKGGVAAEVERPKDTGRDTDRGTSTEPSGEESDKTSRQAYYKDTDHPERVAASLEEVNKKINRYEQHFRNKDEHEIADWMEMLRDHVNEVGTDEALKSLGTGDVSSSQKGRKEQVRYEGEKAGWDSMSQFSKDYLARNGITSVHDEGTSKDVRTISSISKAFGGEGGLGHGGDFQPTDPELKDKLEEAKHLPGLEKSEDLDKLIGQKVTHLTPEIAAKLDEHYGKDQWLVKTYGDFAYAGKGIYFPQKAERAMQDAKSNLWAAGSHLAAYGFSHLRDKNGNVVGIKHNDGQEFKFGTEKYENNIFGDARHWGDVSQASAANEHGVEMPKETPKANFEAASKELGQYGFKVMRGADGKATGIEHSNGDKYQFETRKYEDTIQGKARLAADKVWLHSDDEGKESTPWLMMAQPAFPVVGITNEDRAQGVTFKTGQEGRVHIVTRNGKAEVVPHATWLKNEPMPVVMENEDTRSMAKAAQDAINALPLSERQGSVYAPDVVKVHDPSSPKGYKFAVVEANPSNYSGPSGYLGDNPLVQDAYISHIVGREPAHVQFIRNLLTKKKKTM